MPEDQQQKPSAGRIVQYNHGAGDGHRNGTSTSPAIVTNVFDGNEHGRINLTVFFDGGHPEPRGSIAASGQQGEGEASWQWPARA